MAANCHKCPQGQGRRWCNGDCLWVQGQCISKFDQVCHAASKDVCACGQPRCETNEVHNGVTAKPHKYPWIVRLLGGCLGPCAGTLVSPRVILSAFHCTVSPRTNLPPKDTKSCRKRLAILGRHEIHMDSLS